MVGFESLIEDLTSPNRESILLQVRSLIQTDCSLLSGRGFSITEKKPFPQCTFKPLEISHLSSFLQNLQQILFQGKLEIEIPDISTYMECCYYQFHLNDWVFKILNEKHKKGELVSHGVVSSDKVSATFVTPLCEVDDIHLLRSRTLRCIK